MIKYQFIKSFGFLVTLIKNEKIIIKFYKNNKTLSHWVLGCSWSLSAKLEKDFPEEKVVGHQVIWFLGRFKYKQENNNVYNKNTKSLVFVVFLVTLH